MSMLLPVNLYSLPVTPLGEVCPRTPSVGVKNKS